MRSPASWIGGASCLSIVFKNETANYLMKTAFLQCIRFQAAIFLAGFQPLNPFSDLPWLPFRSIERLTANRI
jgi:hypothetical protein